MKSRPVRAVAIFLAACAAPLALAQESPLAPDPLATLVAEPTASVSRPDDTANAIAAALNADASLKRSKITVQPDDGSILLTGTTETEAQRIRASKIAAVHAGEKVVNAIASSETVIWVPTTEPPAEEVLVPDEGQEQGEPPQGAAPAPPEQIPGQRQEQRP